MSTCILQMRRWGLGSFALLRALGARLPDSPSVHCLARRTFWSLRLDASVPEPLKRVRLEGSEPTQSFLPIRAFQISALVYSYTG